MNKESTPKQALCPHCGQPMIASTPAAGPVVAAPAAPPKALPPKKANETWHDRPPLL